MHVFLRESISYADREYAPGLHEVSSPEYHALSQRGPVRPATQDELERGEPVMQSAAIKRTTEKAARNRTRA